MSSSPIGLEHEYVRPPERERMCLAQGDNGVISSGYALGDAGLLLTSIAPS